MGKYSKYIIPNLITSIRILCSVAIIFCDAFSPAFYTFFIVAGLSDMLDGYVARRTETTSEFGSKLDSLGDALMFTVCVVKLLPIISPVTWLLIWAGVIAILKITGVIIRLKKTGKISIPHSIPNRILGTLLFFFPLTINVISDYALLIFLCLFATVICCYEIIVEC